MTDPVPASGALIGCTLIVAADRRSSDLAGALERHGARVHRAPALSILPAQDDGDLLRITREVIAEPPDIVVVTTGVGLRGWMDAAHEHDLVDALTAALEHSRFVARGPKAHGAILQAGFRADWVAESETAAEVIEYLLAEDLSGRRIVVQHHGAGADGIDARLRAAGADVVSLVIYRWGPPADPRLVERSVRQAASGEADAVLFTSAPGASEWIRAAARCGVLSSIRRRSETGRLLLAVVGPVTARPLADAMLTYRVAVRGRLGSLARCAIDYFRLDGGAPMRITRAGALSVRSGGVLLDGRFIPLSRSGAALIGALFDARGSVRTREELAEVLPGENSNAHAVEMAVARVREALDGADVIHTVVKRGYRLAVEENP